MNKEQIIPIFFAVDNNYAPFLSVVLESIKANSSKDYQYDIYVLNNDISEEYINKINLYNDKNIKINFFSLKERFEAFEGKLPTRDYYSTAIYYRLFIADLFPELDKALYLDADITVLGDISELYNHELGENYLGVISEDVVYSYDEFIMYARHALNIKDPNYFNSGVLVMNLKKIREDKILEKFIRMLGKISFYVAPDQDYLNVICKDKVLYIEQDWNKTPLPHIIFTENVKLIHYKLTAKPWHYDTIHHSECFWQYAKNTPFYDHLKILLKSYPEDAKRKDATIEVELKKLAISETKRITEFCKKNGSLESLFEDSHE